jgi:PhoPQ-activated pathogenicity-related protein
MKANCWFATNRLRVVDVPDPKALNPRDAVVRITLTAICGSDLHLWNGFVLTMEPGDVLDYLAKADPTDAWKLGKTIPGDGVTSYVLDLKSQTWRSTPEVDRPVWQHWLTITRPDKVTSDTAFLSIGGGRNGGDAPTATPADAIDRARRTGTVVVSLGQVPNEPLVFNSDGKDRVEDDLIAYCDVKFLDTGDPTWVARLPMVKSAIRAMGAATEFLASADGGKVAVRRATVARRRTGGRSSDSGRTSGLLSG